VAQDTPFLNIRIKILLKNIHKKNYTPHNHKFMMLFNIFL